MIFQKILNRFLSVLSPEVSDNVAKLVEATQYVYNKVEQTLRPTPNKSHYTFNLRDMSKIFQGVCAANPKTCTDKLGIIKLWIHENCRVFGDRMINEQDKAVLNSLLNDQAGTKFLLKSDDIYTADRIIFGDFMNGNEGENRPYDLIEDMAKFQKKITDYLEDMNAGAKHPMKLVMFLDACEHVSRICRILRQPLGNGLLLGVGGSGRQSLTKLATYIQNYRKYQIEVTKSYNMKEWRENVKTVLMMCGVEGKPTTFLFVDTQIISEQMLEDINNILNSGEIAGLYRTEDLEPIFSVGKVECQRKGLIPNKMNFMASYVSRVKQNIHMVIAMSPLGEVFRNRLRMFPSLVNCCTIDWFTNWPAEALISVGTGFVRDNEFGLNEND
jgi:dynein heavy chain, axonemal